MKKFYVLFALSLLVGRMGAQDPVSYSVENDITHAYLNEFSYDTIPDYNVSYVLDYIARPHDYRLDAPTPIRLSWNHEEGAEAQRIEISESQDYSDSIVFTINKDTAQYDLYNMIPGMKYYYRIVSVKDSNESTVSEGQLEPTGMLRWIYAEGTWNVRDMGGWKGLGGHPIAYGKIFRGGQLTKPNSPYSILLTESGIEAMRNAGIRAELDLRSSSQAHYSYASFAKQDANNNYDADFTNIATTSARMWKYDKDDSNIRAFQWVIDELKAGKPVFYHCQNGADRTGTMGFLIGALLGMSEGDLAKDYELTTFCQDAAVKFDPTEKDFARLRNYEGKYGSEDKSSDPEDYMFAPLIDKLRGVSGTSIQRKIYDFFKTGKSGTKISEEDLDWFIKEMVDYVMVKDITYSGSGETVLKMNPGETFNLNASVAPADASVQTITYKSSNEAAVTVSDDGVITAVRGSNKNVKITISCDGVVKTVTVSVPVIESYLPMYATYKNVPYYLKSDLYSVVNGSFEYAGHFYNWKDPKKAELKAENFDVKNYENSDSVYIESKFDGDDTSEGSLYAEWNIGKKKAFVFGFRIRNTKDTAIVENPNLKVMLTTRKATDNSGATILEFPSYDGNWTDVQYVFYSGDNNNHLRILFTHLSQNGNNTCFDNFYLSEIDTTRVGVTPILKPVESKIYDLNGRPVNENARGILIKDGKKVLIFE